jgi:hypothetical protein
MTDATESRTARALGGGGWAVAIARTALGAYLAFLGLAFLLHGRHGFARYGLDDRIRVALGACELAAGILFAWPRTARVGAAALVVVLAFASGLHAGIREPFGMLVVYAAAVAALGLISRPATRGGDASG